MAIKNIIAKGVGFTDVGDVVKWIPTHGFATGGVVAAVNGPGAFVAGTVYLPGFRAAGVYLPGFRAGTTHLPGFTAGQKAPDGG